MIRYELHIEGSVFPSNSIQELRRMANGTALHYEIYKIIPSIPIGNTKNQKLTFDDLMEIGRLRERGYSIATIADKYHVGRRWLYQLLKDYQIKTHLKTNQT